MTLGNGETDKLLSVNYHLTIKDKTKNYTLIIRGIKLFLGRIYQSNENWLALKRIASGQVFQFPRLTALKPIHQWLLISSVPKKTNTEDDKGDISDLYSVPSRNFFSCCCSSGQITILPHQSYPPTATTSLNIIIGGTNKCNQGREWTIYLQW